MLATLIIFAWAAVVVAGLWLHGWRSRWKQRFVAGTEAAFRRALEWKLSAGPDMIFWDYAGMAAAGVDPAKLVNLRAVEQDLNQLVKRLPEVDSARVRSVLYDYDACTIETTVEYRLPGVVTGPLHLGFGDARETRLRRYLQQDDIEVAK